MRESRNKLLIRRAVTWDRVSPRHQVQITADAVASALQTLPPGWTTREVAKRLGVPERSVRGAVHWLLERGLVKKTGAVTLLTRTTGREYRAACYMLVPPNIVDVQMLNALFMRLEAHAEEPGD